MQGSFLVHFDLLGAIPNLVFIFFFLLTFFDHGQKGAPKKYRVIFFAAIAGIFLDIFSYTYFGPSIVLLIAIALLLKSAQSLLKDMKDNYPFICFLPLFITFFLIYDVAMASYLYFLESGRIAVVFSIGTIFSVIYSSIIASACFFVYKKFVRGFLNGKNLPS